MTKKYECYKTNLLIYSEFVTVKRVILLSIITI